VRSALQVLHTMAHKQLSPNFDDPKNPNLLRSKSQPMENFWTEDEKLVIHGKTHSSIRKYQN
jgi:hypothetical protein